MPRLTVLTITCLLLVSSVGCFRSRYAGYGGCGGCGCSAPTGGGVYGAPAGGYYSPTGASVNMGVPGNGPVAYGTPIYGPAYATTAMAPMDPLPLY